MDWLTSGVTGFCTGLVLLFLRSLLKRLDRLEDQNRKDHAALTAQVTAQGNVLTDVRVEVGRLSGKLSAFTGEALLAALRRVVGGKGSVDPRD